MDDIDDDDGMENTPETQNETKKDKSASAEEDKRFKEKFHTHKITADTVDHYEVLGLAHLRWEATEADIRKAYRKMSLQYHPDKLGASADPDHPVDDSLFKVCSSHFF